MEGDTRNAEHARAFERDQQLWQERRTIYGAYWRAWNALIRILEGATDGGQEAKARIKAAEAEWRHAIDPMFIVCGKDVLEAGITHIHATEARITAARNGVLMDGVGKSRALSRAMRGDLGA
ncbi:hypothetical protein ACFFV7_47440 [Nonomuraea spiralis]|uniref:Uncharacterized protein n=1 Tax=Nonomuraea spiralis TaxID=46182 RepID=A0ABV5IWE4_9ACTN|nr:hypothetical protein [Nonomuraea spiralis]GGT45210.1 hypothetical protein GCM10010176_105660 [Nonomuraea spiralis]